MASLWFSTNKWLTWFHRWAGVALGAFFAMWFASGAVLHYVGFPALAGQEQYAAAPIIDLSRVHVAPGDAVAFMPDVDELRLVSVAGRPLYAARAALGSWVTVAADSGERLPLLSAVTARVVAEDFARSPAQRVSGLVDYDQWIVHQRFDAYRPFYRVRLADAARTDLYVSSRTGEVVQRTRLRERSWNWAGAVIHWLYFTPLRKSWTAWNQVVWWLSLIALASSVVGTWLGVVRTVANRRAGRAGVSPFRGWMRWHHVIGLFASVCLVTWILSGWLSMDHGRLFSRGEASRGEVVALRGMSVAQAAAVSTPAALAAVSPASVISFNAVAGHPFLTAYGGGARPGEAGRPPALGPRTLALDPTSVVAATLPDALLEAAVQRVWPAAVRAAATDGVDALYRHAESTDAESAGFAVPGAHELRLYVDRHTGRFVAVMDSSRRGYAWVYYALHTLQFPGLIERPGVRTALVLGLLCLGFAFSVTGVVLGVLRLKRDFLTQRDF